MAIITDRSSRIEVPIHLLLLTIIFSCQAIKEQPNIVLIMADDMGFSDIGCYGGEIETPNIDRLGNEGMRFQTFYNMAKCNPTRSSMLTGLYQGGNGAVHLAHLTQSAGYTNLMCGKDHLDNWVPDYCDTRHVFDHSLHFNAITEYFVPPSGEFSRPFILDGKRIDAEEIEHEISPMYKTDFITDYALKWMNETIDDQDPFFLYLPYHVAHYPLQARPEDIDKYRGKYLKGWDRLRQERFNKMRAIGIIPQEAQLSPPENNVNKFRGPFIDDYTDYFVWDSLSPEKQDSLDLEMAVYAAMIDRMDQNIGRIIDALEASGNLDNTLIMFLIDNGACPFYNNENPDILPGPADSYWSLRTSWANLGNTPYRQYKQCGHEGGSHTPMIAFWPDHISPHSITDQPGHVVDIAPTLLELLGIEYPTTIEGFPTLPLHGSSLLPIFLGKKRKEPAYFLSGFRKFRMYRSGAYKMVQMNGEKWELYDIKKDPTELNDLADEKPKKVNQMLEDYERVLKNQNLWSLDEPYRKKASK
jgi:arylsulfatase A-like enzyme